MDSTRVPLEVPTRAPGGRTNAYVLGRDAALLVDPATVSEDLDEALADREVAGVAVTHHHRDHVGGVAHYAAAHEATVWARRGREAAFETATGVAPDRTFGAGTTIDTDGGPVTVVDTPGHAREHVAFRFVGGGDGGVMGDAGVVGGDVGGEDGDAGDAPAEEYLVGDLAVAEGSVVVGPPEGDMRAYLSSLRRLWARNPHTLHPGHGPTIEAPRETLVRLIDHRNEREERVLAAVQGGAHTVPEITDAAYDKDVSDVRDLAEATVRAHLEKLAAEKRVAWDGARAEPA